MPTVKRITEYFAAAAMGALALCVGVEGVRNIYQSITSPEGQLLAKQFGAAASWLTGGIASYLAGIRLRARHGDGEASLATAMPYGFFGGIASGVAGWQLAAHMLPQLVR